MIGKILGNRYEILEKIGTGGMGDVYKAHCRRLDRIVAIKTLKSEFNDDNNFIRKFKRESLAAASISHPNIVSIYDVGTEELGLNKIHYIVMEYIDGNTLKDLINKEGKFTEKRALNYTVQIAEALKVAHSKNIVHRDIKSQNIMITKDDRVKVTDFGIARVADNSTVTATNAIMGSVHYFSPEQARGTKVDNRSDIYSLGIVLYEMLTGKLPFEAENPVSVALMQVQSNMPLPSARNNDVSSATDQIVIKMTMKEANDRYKDVYTLIRDIKNIQLGRTSNINYREEARKNRTMPISKTGIKSSPILNSKNSNKREYQKPQTKKTEKKKGSSLPVILGIVCALLLIVMLAYFAPKVLSGDIGSNKQEEISTVEVPDVVGMSQEEAKASIEAAGFEISISGTEEREDKENKEVLSQDPRAKEMLKKGSIVKITVNRIPDFITIPDLTDKTLEEAQAIVQSKGLTINKIDMETSNTIEEGKIISQDPGANSEVVKNKNISVVVSKGSEDTIITIPSLKGVNGDNAKGTLERLGFKVEVEYVKSNAVGLDDVVDYEPKEKAEKDSTITLYVSDGLKDETSDENEDSSDESNLPSNLTVRIPDDDSSHQVRVKRITESGNEYEIYNYNKSSEDGEVKVPLEYIKKGDTFEIYIDEQKVRTEKIK
ncbi:MAG: Stk1 family PASTA domain-containing Ser/Thr kinase [Peptoniphilaceae bacterium]